MEFRILLVSFILVSQQAWGGGNQSKNGFTDHQVGGRPLGNDGVPRLIDYPLTRLKLDIPATQGWPKEASLLLGHNDPFQLHLDLPSVAHPLKSLDAAPLPLQHSIVDRKGSGLMNISQNGIDSAQESGLPSGKYSGPIVDSLRGLQAHFADLAIGEGSPERQARQAEAVFDGRLLLKDREVIYSDEAVERLRKFHWATLDTSGFALDNAGLREAYDKVLNESGIVSRYGNRYAVDLPIAPLGPNERAAVKLPPSLRLEVNRWARYLLQTAQKAFPKEKLKIRSVSLGKGWNAGRKNFPSIIHLDFNEVYLRATCTLKGESTILFPESASARLNLQEARFAYLQSKDDSGNITIHRFDHINGRSLGAVILDSSEYVQPPEGRTVMLTGLGRQKKVPHAEPTYHVSPLFGKNNPAEDRLTLFLDIVSE